MDYWNKEVIQVINNRFSCFHLFLNSALMKVIATSINSETDSNFQPLSSSFQPFNTNLTIPQI